jgi:sulfoxide reductase heme-binding subunit YedZ
MNILRSILNSHYLFWFVLAFPSWHLVVDVWKADLYYAEIMYESGTWSVIFMVIALAITPLMRITGNSRIVFWLQKRRRAIGVASFGFAALHTYFYVRYVGSLELIVLEAFDTVFWLGWLGFVLLLVLAMTSNQMSVRKLGRSWKLLQRTAYAALFVSLLHWWWIEQFIPSLIYWAAIIAALQVLRLIFTSFNAARKRPTSSLPQ